MRETVGKLLMSRVQTKVGNRTCEGTKQLLDHRINCLQQT